MRRLVNFRAPLFIAIGFILGILSYYEYLFGNILFGLISAISVLAISVIYFILTRKIRIGVIAVVLAVVFGFLLSHLNYFLINKNNVTQKDVLITGRVCDLCRNGESNSPAVYLENCYDEDGVKYKGCIQTYVFDCDVKTGDILTLRGTLNSTYPVKSTVLSYLLRDNILYELDTQTVVSQSSGAMKFDESARRYIYDVSIKYASDNGDVLYALLTGDRNALSADKYEYFKIAGIIHLLAVSGLHVGFIVGTLGIVLKRFKLFPLAECAILIVPLLLYAYICNFTPSVIRAIVMVVCSYIARAVFGRYDMLTSLSWAVIIILSISPFNLFDVGFQLSALSVFGISTVYGTLNRYLSRRKIPVFLKRLINSAAISLSCSVATFFTLQLNYGYAPVLGILLNIVVIPLVTAAFVTAWIGMIPWIFHYLLLAVDLILKIVVWLAKCVSELSFACVSVSAVAFSVIVVAVWLFVLGGYVNLRKAGKIVVNSALSLLLVLCVGLSYVKTKPPVQTYVAIGYNDSMCVATSADGYAVIAGNFSDKYAYNQSIRYISKYKLSSCALYITDYGEADISIVKDLLKYLPVTTVYKLDFSYNAEVDGVFDDFGVDVYQQMENTSSGNSITVTSVFDGELRAVVIKNGTLTTASVYGNDFAVEGLLETGIKSDVFVLPGANKAYSSVNSITLSLFQSDLPFNYGANKYGNFTITQKGDTIKIKFR